MYGHIVIFVTVNVADIESMSSSILDLSMSRGTAADTSSGRAAPCRSPFTPLRHDSVTPELRVATKNHDRDHGQATSSDCAVDDHLHAADTDDKEATISSRTVSGSSSDVSDDPMSRDIADRLPHRSRDQSQTYQYLDYQAAAAAAAAAARFLVPFPFPSPSATATGSAPMTSSVPPMNFYPLSFPALPPPPEAAIHFRPDGAAAAGSTPCHGAGSSRSTADLGVKVKDDDLMTSPVAVGHVVDPTYAERRRKNNEAARRSRDARRMKERETCLRAALLQQENVRLRAEMAVLKTEIARLHCLLYDKM